MDKISKFLKSLSSSKEKKINRLVDDIIKNNLDNLDCKKLRGMINIYRVRSGNIRVLFQKTKSEENVIISIENKKESTYKNL